MLILILVTMICFGNIEGKCCTKFVVMYIADIIQTFVQMVELTESCESDNWVGANQTFFDKSRFRIQRLEHVRKSRKLCLLAVGIGL